MMKIVRNSLIMTIVAMMISLNASGQTSVFSDDFSTNTSATYTTSGAIGSSVWTVARSGADWGARRNTSPAQLELTNDVGATANVLGWTYVYAAPGSFSSPYNTTLSSNTGVITWYFNIRSNRSNLAGFSSGSYGMAFVIGANGNDVSSASTNDGYALVLGNSSAPDPFRFGHFTDGLDGFTALITSNTTGLTDIGTNYYSVKITYDPSSNTWEFFLRNDGASAFADPASGSLTSQGTIVNSTFTGTALTSFGAHWQGSTGATQTAFFDNISVTHTSAASPVITTSVGSLSSFGDVVVGSSSSSLSFTVQGIDLTNDIVVTPPTGFEIRKDSDPFSTTPITLTQSGGTVSTTTIDVRFTPGTAGAFSANVACTSTGATTKNVSVSGNGVLNYYSAATGDLDNLASWGTNTDGTGANPSNFTGDGQIFNIRNNATPTIGANWTVSGSASKIILGDGSNAVNFSIPGSNTVTGTIDLASSSTLTLNNSTLAHTYGTISANSTINYAQTGTYAVPSTPTTYGNVTLTGGTKTFSSGTYTIQGNLVVDGVTDFDGAGSPFTTVNLAGNFTLLNSTTFAAAVSNRMTLVCNGSSAQTLTGNGSSFHVFRITVNNSAGVALSTSGGTSNATVGNTSGGGVTLTLGNLTTNSNTITVYNSATPSILTETAAKSIIGNVSMTKTVGVASSTMGNIGLSLAAGTDDLGDVTITRVTGADGIVTAEGNTSIARKYTVSSTNPPTNGRTVTITWLSNEDNSKTLTIGAAFKSTNSGTSWTQEGTGDYTTRSVALSGQTSFGMYTIGDTDGLLPVEIRSFDATVSGRGVELNWSTATETNNHGFEVEKNVSGTWSKIGFVEGHGTTNSPQSYSFVDASARGTVSYRLKQIDRDGKFTYSQSVEATVVLTAEDFELAQNYPNPFNPTTNITFAMKNAEQVNVTVYNALGQAVAILFNGVAEPNRLYTLSFDGKNLSSGMYFYKLRSASRNEVKKMLLTK